MEEASAAPIKAAHGTGMRSTCVSPFATEATPMIVRALLASVSLGQLDYKFFTFLSSLRRRSKNFIKK